MTIETRYDYESQEFVEVTTTEARLIDQLSAIAAEFHGLAEFTRSFEPFDTDWPDEKHDRAWRDALGIVIDLRYAILADIRSNSIT